MKNFWYDALAYEMFLDLDSRRALRRAVTVLLQGMKTGKLQVNAVYIYPTKQSGHYHMIIVFVKNFQLFEKMAWALWMGNDRLRMAYVLARLGDERMPPQYKGDLLVTNHEYYRVSDAVCSCVEKHKADEVTEGCPAMRALLGEARSADYFARTGERHIKPLKVRVQPGRIELDVLQRWINGEGALRVG